ncbi:MAG TPA: hypothetical protein VGD47_07345 [Steroidobacteraceae bacterium]
MSKSIGIASLAAALALATVSFAQAPAGAPAGTNGLCKDGSYYSGATKRGACAGHKGVKQWYGAAAAAGSAAAPAPATAVPAAPPATATKSAQSTASTAAAPGAGPGMVWVNKATKTYHCSSDKWYGKTKSGEYLSEADAKTQGFHAAHGKACQ